MNSFAFIEFSSIADGLDYTHLISKQVDLDIHHQEIMCPGKYVLQLCGKEGNIKQAMAYLDTFKSMLSAVAVLNIHMSVLSAINQKITVEKGCSYGLIETRHYVKSLEIADKIAKNSTVKIERIVDRLGLIGKGLIIFSGSSSELKSASNIATQYLKEEEIVSISILESVKENIFSF